MKQSSASSSVAAESTHWVQVAQRWAQVGPPLRPSAPDIAAYRDAFAGTGPATPLRVLILGVTPELWTLPWPRRSDVLAADRSLSMINAIWPGPSGSAIQADWTNLPLANASRDLVLCDGGLHLLGFPGGQASLARSIARVLAPGGALAIRLFVPPPVAESPDAVLACLVRRDIADMSELKLRLLMALHRDPAAGVCLADAWKALHAVAPDLDALASQLGWAAARARTVDTYRDCPDTYHFVDLDQFRHLFTQDPGGFVIERVHVPGYPHGERCPTLILRRAGPASPP